jgi:hypothetical protein
VSGRRVTPASGACHAQLTRLFPKLHRRVPSRPLEGLVQARNDHPRVDDIQGAADVRHPPVLRVDEERLAVVGEEQARVFGTDELVIVGCEAIKMGVREGKDC